MRTDSRRILKYDKKVGGLVLPGQAKNYAVTQERQVKITEEVKRIVGPGLNLVYYIGFGNEIEMILNKHAADIAANEICIRENKWVDRGLDRAKLNLIEDYFNIVHCPVEECTYETKAECIAAGCYWYCDACQGDPPTGPYLVDGNTLALYHCDDDQATTVIDETGNYNMQYNGAWTATSKWCRALYFNGTLQCGASTTLLDTVPSNGTIEFWFNSDTDIGTSHLNIYFVHKRNETDQYILIHSQANDDRICGRFNVGGSIYAVYSQHRTYTAGTWYHVVFTWGSEGMELWIDGVLEGTDPYTGKPNNGTYKNFYVGRSDETPIYRLQGKMDEIRVSNVQRNPPFSGP